MWMWLNNKLFGTRYVVIKYWFGSVSNIIAVNKTHSGWAGWRWPTLRAGFVSLNDDFTFKGENYKSNCGDEKSEWIPYYGWKQKTP